MFDEAVDDDVGGNTLGLGAEVGENSVTQHRVSERLNIGGSDVSATIEHDPSLGRNHEALRSPETGPPIDSLIDEIWGGRLIRAGGAGETNGIASSLLRDRRLPHHLLESE